MPRESKGKSPTKKPKSRHYDKILPGTPNAQGDVYDDVKLDDESDPSAYLGDQYIMLGDEHPEGHWQV